MQQKGPPKDKKRIGYYGESIATKYLDNKGYQIIERNYRKPWGEIDIVAKNNGSVVFVEVKTVSYETRDKLQGAISHGTWRPEENVHPYKVAKLSRAIESWLRENNWEGEWQIDVVSVRCVPRETYATIKHIPNIVL